MRFDVVSLWLVSAVEEVRKLGLVTRAASWRSEEHRMNSGHAIPSVLSGVGTSRSAFVPLATSMLRVDYLQATTDSIL
jgi:hypothetical protein